MKKLSIIIFSLILSCQIFANERLSNLKRQITVVGSDGKSFELYYAKKFENKVLYVSFWQDYDMAAVEISENREGDIVLSLFSDDYGYGELNNPGVHYKFNMGTWVAKNQSSIKFQADHIDLENTIESILYEENLQVNYKKKEELKTPLIDSITISGDMFASNKEDRIKSDIRTNGIMTFSPCDGCEHSDQLWIGSVNAINIDLGDYYEEDCSGTFHIFFETLLNLEVPMTFMGQVSSVTQDLWEGDFWTATNDGRIYLGDSTNLLLVSFMDSLESRFSKFSGAIVVRSDLERGLGIFKNEAMSLTFVYKDNALQVDLKTGLVKSINSDMTPTIATDLMSAVSPAYGEYSSYDAEDQLDSLTREIKLAFIKIYSPQDFCTERELPYFVRSEISRTATALLPDLKKCQSFLKFWNANDRAREWTKGFRKVYAKVNSDQNEISYIFEGEVPKLTYMNEVKKIVIKLKTTSYTRKHLSSKLWIK